jgi:hypothetical protein
MEIKRPDNKHFYSLNLFIFLTRYWFMMKHPIILYKIVAGIAFVVLASVQFFLLFNMYRMEDEHYYAIEKKKMHDVYEPTIRNDKLYPGAVQIIDKYVYKYIDTLGVLYKQRQMAAFDSLRQIMCDSMFAELRTSSCGDSLIHSIKKQLAITDSLQYCMLISNIDFAFDARKYVPIYTRGVTYPLINRAIQGANGIRIAGMLKNINPKNSISSLIVSSPLARSYKMDFSLHIDTPGRVWRPVDASVLARDQRGLSPLVATDPCSRLGLWLERSGDPWFEPGTPDQLPPNDRRNRRRAEQLNFPA